MNEVSTDVIESEQADSVVKMGFQFGTILANGTSIGSHAFSADNTTKIRIENNPTKTVITKIPLSGVLYWVFAVNTESRVEKIQQTF